MRLQKLRCEHCQKRYEKRGEGQKYCSHKCRQAAYRHRKLGDALPKKHPAKKPVVQKSAKREIVQIPAYCDHCHKDFWAKSQRAQFCSTSCRVMHHRAMRNAIPDALALIYGLPVDKALDLLETQPISRIKATLTDCGWTWSAQRRAWVQALEMVQA